MAKKFHAFIPLYKVDEEQRLVYGRATQEVLDKSREVMDYDTSKPYFQAWSTDFASRSGGLSKGNLRVMHQLTVAGKLTDIEFLDDAKAIDVVAKVVDDDAWEKVKEGCFTGFSVGGTYVKRWADVVNGDTVQRYTAKPHELSLVDDPCVPTAGFSYFKVGGNVEEVHFKKAGDSVLTLKNEDVVAKATTMAEEANDGTTWMDHVPAARDALLLKATSKGKPDDEAEKACGGEKADKATDTNPDQEASPDPKAGKKTKKKKPKAGDEDGDEDGKGTSDEDGDEDKCSKVTPPGVRQVWTASDGKTFEKKADAETHESTLGKAAPSEAEQLAARLAKATNPTPPTIDTPLLEDPRRMADVIAAISAPFGDDGKPKLEKGMYTVSRLSSILADLASIIADIKREGVAEADSADVLTSSTMMSSLTSLGIAFAQYARDQVAEILTSLDGDLIDLQWDYFYNVNQAEPENQLAKDVVSILTEAKPIVAERREGLKKLYTVETPAPVGTDDLQKRFDALQEESAAFKKIAEDAVSQVEELAKRVQKIEDEPMARAPNPANIAYREGDTQFFGKAVNSEEDKLAVLHDMLKAHGPDHMATLMIKASHASGGQQLDLVR
jgi:hypothetical protein